MKEPKPAKIPLVGWIFIAAIILVFISPVFMYAYEPLALLAEKGGAEESEIYKAPMPDYTISGIGEIEGGVLSGIVGVFITIVVCFAVARVLHTKHE